MSENKFSLRQEAGLLVVCLISTGTDCIQWIYKAKQETNETEPYLLDVSNRFDYPPYRP